MSEKGALERKMDEINQSCKQPLFRYLLLPYLILKESLRKFTQSDLHILISQKLILQELCTYINDHIQIVTFLHYCY